MFEDLITIKTLLYYLRWQIAFPIYYFCGKKYGNKKGTFIAGIIGATVFILVDKFLLT